MSSATLPKEVFVKKDLKSRLMLISSMAIFGTLAPFVRRIPVSSGALALCRAAMASVLIAVILLITKQKIPVSRMGKQLPLLIASGAAMGVNWILLFEAYKRTTVSVATLSYYFAPVLVTVLCPLLFKEKLTAKQIVCFIASTAGLVLITGIGTGGGDHLGGILFALGAAVLYASVVLINKFIRDVDGIHRTLLQFLAAAVVLLPYVLLTGDITTGPMDATGWLCLLAVGIIHTGLAYCFYFSALKDLSGQEASILSYIDPLVAVLISVTVLGEPMTPWQILGGLLILGFTLWNELPSRVRRPK
ncbi:MAG: EamA/RhaT family transporter [Ruminococcaceae bacterium]|nr:EamA/RhaT family transporter [Oscillospiraceae bacterium]